MSKKSRRNKQWVVNTEPPPKLLFTLPAIRMLKDALRPVEAALLSNTKPLPNLEFAAETLTGLQIKLDDMLQLEDWDRKTPFDYNELHILYAAIHMHLVELTMAKNQQLMPTCLQLCKQFSFVIETIPPKQVQAPQ